MIINTILTVGAWSAAATSGVVATAIAVNWYRYSKSIMAAASGESFFKHCYKKYIQKDKARRKGYAGEFELAKQLEKVKGAKQLLFNVLIPAGPNGTTEIDALLIHETGIYVFENKNFGGTIGCFSEDKQMPKLLGNIKADALKWDIVYNEKTVKSMYNPILQNEKHALFIKRLLAGQNIGSQRLFSYVTFNDDAKIKGAPLDFKLHFEGKVLAVRHLAEDLNAKISQRGAIITPQKMETITSILKPFSRVTEQARQKHRTRVAERSAQQNESPDIQPPKAEQFVPLNDAIHSAKNAASNSKDPQHKPTLKNYMNMFRE